MIRGLAVSVNYADYLVQALPTWLGDLDDLLVVTDCNDIDTRAICHAYGVQVYSTDAFYQDGRIFGKALAICTAIDATGWFADGGWRCFLDADILLPEGWRKAWERLCPQTGNLYGAPRYLESGHPIADQDVPGYFQIFDSDDPNVQRSPLLDTSWRHAGGYDTEFQGRWALAHRVWLPIRLTHLGRPFTNWWGRDNHRQMQAMWNERERGHIGEKEKVNG